MTELPKHPASFSAPVLDLACTILFPLVNGKPGKILDPFAGIGKIHSLARPGVQTIGVELEKEWADYHPDTICGDMFKVLAQLQHIGKYDAIVTSPAYGNRMADHHNAKDDSHRRTYKHYLGRDLSPNSSGAMQWGDDYRAFHRKAWILCHHALKPGGVMLLNVSDHVRKKEVQPVALFHENALKEAGFAITKVHEIKTARYRFGANSEARVTHEVLIEARK